MKDLQEKCCMNCQHGITIPGFPYECSFMIDGKWFHKGGYCPEQLICDHWKVNGRTGMSDQREMWANATVIDVE